MIINDRLLAPNTAETFAALEPDLRAFFDKLYNGAEYTLTQQCDPRERFTVNVKTAASFDVETLLKNLSVEEPLMPNDLPQQMGLSTSSAAGRVTRA